MRRFPRSVLLSTVAAAAVMLAPEPGAAQSPLSVSPFVSFLPAGGASPLAGLALAIAGTSGLGVRGSANLSLANANYGFNTGAARPWGADADLVLSLGGGFGTLTPYVFSGIGVAGTRTDALAQATHNWSYGVGARVPLGGAVDLFGESRWRMSRYVLPTAPGAPAPTDELRVGVSFHVGGGSAPARRGRRSRSR